MFRNRAKNRNLLIEIWGENSESGVMISEAGICSPAFYVCLFLDSRKKNLWNLKEIISSQCHGLATHERTSVEIILMLSGFADLTQ